MCIWQYRQNQYNTNVDYKTVMKFLNLFFTNLQGGKELKHIEVVFADIRNTQLKKGSAEGRGKQNMWLSHLHH